MFKYELHAHTSDCDKCALLSGKELVRAYHDAGYDGMVITDHYFSLFFSWFGDELKGLSHDKVIERYLKGYYSAINEAEKYGFTVLCGAEVRLGDSINDYLVYGLDEQDLYSLPLLCECKDLSDLRSCLPQKALIVQAHPFRNGMTLCDPDLLFGYETFNNGTDGYRNALAYDFAEHYGKHMTSGSDCHSSEAVAKGGIETKNKIICADDLKNTLISGDYLLITPAK